MQADRNPYPCKSPLTPFTCTDCVAFYLTVSEMMLRSVGFKVCHRPQFICTMQAWFPNPPSTTHPLSDWLPLNLHPGDGVFHLRTVSASYFDPECTAFTPPPPPHLGVIDQSDQRRSIRMTLAIILETIRQPCIVEDVDNFRNNIGHVR